MINTNYIYNENQLDQLMTDATTIGPTEDIVGDPVIGIKPDLKAQEGAVTTQTEGNEAISVFENNSNFIDETSLNFSNFAWNFVNGVNEVGRRNMPNDMKMYGAKNDRGVLIGAGTKDKNNQQTYYQFSTREDWDKLTLPQKLYIFNSYKRNILAKPNPETGEGGLQIFVDEAAGEDVSLYENATNADLAYESYTQFQNQHLSWMQQAAVQGDANRNAQGLSTFKYPYLSSLFTKDANGNVSIVDKETWLKKPQEFLLDVKSQAWSLDHIDALLSLQRGTDIPEGDYDRLLNQFNYIKSNKAAKEDPNYFTNVNSYLKEIHKKYGNNRNLIRGMRNNYLDGNYGPDFQNKSEIFSLWGKQYLNKDITGYEDIMNLDVNDEMGQPGFFGWLFKEAIPNSMFSPYPGLPGVGFATSMARYNALQSGDASYQGAMLATRDAYDLVLSTKGGVHDLKSRTNPAYIGTNRGGGTKAPIQIVETPFKQYDNNNVLTLGKDQAPEYREFKYLMYHLYNPHTFEARYESGSTVNQDGSKNIDPNYISITYNPSSQTIEGCSNCFLNLDNKNPTDDKSKNLYQYFTNLFMPNIVDVMSDKKAYVKTQTKTKKGNTTEKIVENKTPVSDDDFVNGRMTFIPEFEYNGKKYVGYNVKLNPKFIDKKLSGTKVLSSEESTVDDKGNVVVTDKVNKSDASAEILSNLKTNGFTILLPVNVATNLQFEKDGQNLNRSSQLYTQYKEAVNNTPLEIWFGNPQNKEYTFEIPKGGGLQIVKDIVEVKPGETKPVFTITNWAYELQTDGTYKKVIGESSSKIEYEQIFSFEKYYNEAVNELKRRRKANVGFEKTLKD